jgi:hypothetical protein
MTAFRVFLFAALLPLLACGAETPLPDAARISAAQLGSNEDVDLRAIQLAAWSFSEPARLRGHPVDTARAAASVDYLAGELYASPRFQGVSPLYKRQMLEARGEVRAALGVAPSTSSQEVVDRLTAAGNAMQAGDLPAAAAAVTAPAFTLGPQATLQRLNALPFLPAANVATLHIDSDVDGPNDNCEFGCG